MSEIDVSKCEFWCELDEQNYCTKEDVYCADYEKCMYKQLQKLKAENEELHEKCAKIIHRATGGRLTYSTYTLEAVEQAFYDQLDIMVEQRTEELEQENEALKQSEQEGLEIVAELKHKNEELKYDKELYEDLNRQKRLVAQQLIKDNTELIKDNEELQGYYQNEHCDVLKLTKCLDEIEEIVNKYKIGSGNLYGVIRIPDVIQIAEKIKEVKKMSEIDVSKCYYYNDDNSPFCCELYDNECEAQNCYFQQLQQQKKRE